MQLYVNTSFGCICGGKLECKVCGSGRRYKIEVENTQKVQRIWQLLCEQNELLKNYTPQMQYEREILDLERRILSYDMLDNSELRVTLPTSACCKSANRKEPKVKSAPAQVPPPAAAIAPEGTEEEDE